jgi:chromosome segregation ATPase
MRNVAYFVAIFIAWTVLGCATRGSVDGGILSYQRQVTELEARNQDLERRAAQYDGAIRSTIESLEELRTRSIGMEGSVDEIIYLFDGYKRAVEQLERDYQNLRDKVTRSN